MVYFIYKHEIDVQIFQKVSASFSQTVAQTVCM